MHAQSQPRLSRHRRARLIAWTLAMLAWLGSVLCGAHIMSRRHLRQRGGLLSLDRLARFVARLIVIRASELIGQRHHKRSFHKHGRDLQPVHLLRSAIGSRLRRALKHRDIAQRIAILIGALNALDAWAARFAKRLARRFTKLRAVLARAGAAEALAPGDLPALAIADTS